MPCPVNSTPVWKVPDGPFLKLGSLATQIAFAGCRGLYPFVFYKEDEAENILFLR